MAFSIRFNEEKNELLKATRDISFEDVQNAIEQDNILANIAHSNQKYSHQRIYIISIKNYAYAVPYVINVQKKEIFLKTIYPSRILTKIYMKGGKDEKNKQK